MDDPKIVEIVYTGCVTSHDLRDALRAALALAHDNMTNRYLADCVQLDSGHSIVDLFEVVTALDQSAIDRQSKEAIVLPVSPEFGSYAQFYEMTCRNRGLNARVFQDRQAAIAWLTE